MDIYEELFGMPRKSVTLEEQLKVLEGFGIHCTSERLLEGVEEQREFAESEDGVYVCLLETIGFAEPFSDKVYAFDSEVSDIELMYTEFLSRIQLLMQNEAGFNEVQETFDEEEGRHGVTFVYNGHTYSFEADDEGDWMDFHIIDFINDVFEKENNEKRLLCMLNESQGFNVLYQTVAWAKKFAEATSIPLCLSSDTLDYILPDK